MFIDYKRRDQPVVTKLSKFYNLYEHNFQRRFLWIIFYYLLCNKY